MPIAACPFFSFPILSLSPCLYSSPSQFMTLVAQPQNHSFIFSPYDISMVPYYLVLGCGIENIQCVAVWRRQQRSSQKNTICSLYLLFKILFGCNQASLERMSPSPPLMKLCLSSANSYTLTYDLAERGLLLQASPIPFLQA